MTATDAAARKRAERDRKRSAGLVKVEVWVRPASAEKVRKHAERLHRIAGLVRARGRPIMGTQKRVRYLVTLEPSVAQRLREYGLGNLSAGITRAAAHVASVVDSCA